MAKIREPRNSPSSKANMTQRPSKKKMVFKLMETMEELCERHKFDPGEAMILGFKMADEVAARSDITPFDALKLKMEIAKVLTNKRYANKVESKNTISGDPDAPVIHEIRRTIVKPK